MTTAVHPNVNTDNTLFRSAILQLLRTVEKLSQNIYRYGPKSRIRLNVPIAPSLNLPIAENPDPALLTYERAREIFSSLQLGLSECEAKLANITSPDVKVRFHIGAELVDLKGNGESQPLWRLFANHQHGREISQREGEAFYIKFDRGDVHWFRGYCHLLMGICDVILAHDWQESFNFGGKLLFHNVQTAYDAVLTRKNEVFDLVAMIHSIHWKVVEPQRLLSALHHFEMVPAESKESWKWIMAETEDDHEWLPNPRQTGVFPGARVSDQMVASWLTMMEQGARILSGEELVPFWRSNEKLGINVRRLFTEPRALDLVNWAQGSGFVPYLESGNGKRIATREEIREVQRAFGRNLPLMALWFN